MEYEKKYKEALERAKKLKETCDSIAVVGWCEYIFPEIKESKDERIRKGIKSVLEHYKESGEIVCPYPFVSIEEALAWLEKQGEQKASYTTIVETGDGGINALVTKKIAYRWL